MSQETAQPRLAADRGTWHGDCIPGCGCSMCRTGRDYCPSIMSGIMGLNPEVRLGSSAHCGVAQYARGVLPS
jgi:hypothetical protein